jgi:hypothetical protein
LSTKIFKLISREIILPVFWLVLLMSDPLMAQIIPDPPANQAWNNWWYDSDVTDIETAFNAARRNEETQFGLPYGILGNLNLPSDFLDRDFKERALIVLNDERQVRHGVNYGNGAVTAFAFEGVENELSNVAQAHADDLQSHNIFSHTSSDGTPWSTRIGNAFPNCSEGMGENIAWNSKSGGFILGVAFSIYNFIYDDSLSFWGHRHLCLRPYYNNNYGEPNKLGLVGFGRAVGNNGDFFVMDFIDPIPSCTYDIIDFGSGSCPSHMDVTGTISSGTYQADQTLASDGTINNGTSVDFMAGSNITLEGGFQLNLGGTLEVFIENCGTASRILPGPLSNTLQVENHAIKLGEPVRRILTEHL